MRKLLIVLVLFFSGCGYYDGYSDYHIPPTKTYNELFPVQSWEIEQNRMDIDAIRRERENEKFMESIRSPW